MIKTLNAHPGVTSAVFYEEAYLAFSVLCRPIPLPLCCAWLHRMDASQFHPTAFCCSCLHIMDELQPHCCTWLQVMDARQGYNEVLKVMVRYAVLPVIALLGAVAAGLKAAVASGKLVL